MSRPHALPTLLLLLACWSLLLLDGKGASAHQQHLIGRRSRALKASTGRPFPYCNCNRSSGTSPWRVSLLSTAPLATGQRVSFGILLDPSIPCTGGLNKIEIDTRSITASRAHRGAFIDAILNGKNFTSIEWETTRPVVKFTNLKLTCAQGVAGVSLVFTITQGATLETICNSSATCQVAAFTQVDGAFNGPCPVSTFAPLPPPASPPPPSAPCRFANSSMMEILDVDTSNVTDCYSCALACMANDDCFYYSFDSPSEPLVSNWTDYDNYGACSFQPRCRWANNQPKAVAAVNSSATCQDCAAACLAAPSCFSFSAENQPWNAITTAGLATACDALATPPGAGACLWSGMNGGELLATPVNASVSCSACQALCLADDSVDACYQYSWQGGDWTYWDQLSCLPTTTPTAP